MTNSTPKESASQQNSTLSDSYSILGADGPFIDLIDGF